jgi:hypothetical protein
MCITLEPNANKMFSPSLVLQKIFETLEGNLSKNHEYLSPMSYKGNEKYRVIIFSKLIHKQRFEFLTFGS